MKVNYHTHTYRCKHAGGTELDYVERAIQEDVKVLGISDHAPFPDHDFGYRMDYKELDEYVNEINVAREKYAGQISVYTGLEIEFFPTYLAYYEELLTKKGIEYMVLGEHSYELPNGEYQNLYFSGSTECYVEYANAIASALKTGYFKILAHPDLCMLNNFKWDYNCDKTVDIIVNAVSSTNTIIEYNANGLRRGIQEFVDGSRYQYPHEKFWCKIADAKLPVVVSADCHNPNQLNDDYMVTAHENIKKFGITPIDYDIFKC